MISSKSMKNTNTKTDFVSNVGLLLIVGLFLCPAFIGCKPTRVPEGANPEGSPKVPEDAILENIHGPIMELHGPSTDGTVSVTIGRYARSFAIHPDFSPDAKVLVEFARQAVNTDKSIDATVWVRDSELSKANPQGSGIPGPPWVIIRLAETKDATVDSIE